MRISTNTLFNANVAQLNTLESNLMQTQQQISSGRRMLTPADDPTAAAQVLQVTQTQQTNLQYTSNIGTVNDAVTLAEGTMQSVTTLLQNVQSTAVSAGNGALSNSDRKSLATSLQADLTQLVSYANTRDANGNYLFSGFKGNTQPFVQTQTGVQYNGDNGQRMIQVSATQQVAASDSGASIFMNIKNGNGTYVSGPVNTNSGSGVISAVSIVNPAPTPAQLGNSYQVTFTVAAGVTTYSVTGTDATGATLPNVAQPGTLPTAQPFTSGQSISFNGVQFDIQGKPANGDTFSVTPSANESVFTTISNLINTLNTGVNPNNTASQAQLSAGLNHAQESLNNALSNVLTVQSSQGSRLNQLTTLTTNGNNLDVQYQQTITNLQSVDYTKAVSDLTLQKTILTAAQQSFVQVENLSIFNYLR